MRTAPISFKEFDGGSVQTPTKVKTFLPGGRFGGEDTPPPPASFSEAQVKEAERDGYKKGFLEGTQEGIKQKTGEQDEVDRKLTEALVGFTQSVAPIFNDYRNMAAQIRQDVPKVALAVARKVAGDALKENAAASVEEIATRCISSMISEPKLTVTVHESLAANLEKRLKDLATKLQAATDIVVVPDAAIAVTDCKVEWKQGAFARNTEQLWQDIERAIGNMSASAAYEASQQAQKVEAEVNAPKEPVNLKEETAPQETTGEQPPATNEQPPSQKE